MEQMEEDVRTSNAWERTGRLLITVRELDEAEKLYHTLLEQTCNPDDQARYYHHLGYIKDTQVDHQGALRCYERALEIRQKSLLANHPHLSSVSESVETVKIKLNKK